MWISTGTLSRAHVSQIGSSSGSSTCRRLPSAFRDEHAEVLEDLQAHRAGLDVGLELLGGLRAEARTDRRGS